MLNAIVLSGGKGTRMKSPKPKVIHKVLGVEMVNLVLDSLKKTKVDNMIVVVGYKSEDVKAVIDQRHEVEYTLQSEQLGTGHAVLQAYDLLKDKTGSTLITYGDTPLITNETFQEFVDYHESNQNGLTILTTKLDNPTGYGRIILNDNQEVEKIVEEKDATQSEKLVNEVNSGVMCFDNKLLLEYITKLDNNNAQEEYYLTDMVEILKSNGHKVKTFESKNSEQLEGVNDLKALSFATKTLQTMINQKHMINGVEIIDSTTTYIGPEVTIGEQTIIYPGTTILGSSKLGINNLVMPNTTIIDSSLGNGNEIGPMAYLRANTIVEDNCRIGNFVEVKNTTIKSGAKSAHLTYLGDSQVGEKVNIGCGVITANYDGEQKHKTKIGRNSFIGSNVNLIAPVEIGEEVFVAAGTTVTQDIEDNKFVIGRTKAISKEKR